MVDDSLVRDIKGWELSDESNKVVTKHFNEANTTDMKAYLLPTKSRNPENIVLHCVTNDLNKENSANEISNYIIEVAFTTQKMTFSVEHFCSKCDQIRGKLRFGHIY